MNTREMAEEYRLTYWAGIMRERKESGQSIRAYCRQRGMHENVYYYWQRKLRAAACEELAGQETLPRMTPAGWTLCTAEPNVSAGLLGGGSSPGDQLAVEVNGIRITAGSDYPVEKLAQFIRELQRGC